MMFFHSFGGAVEIKGGATVVDDFDDNQLQQQPTGGLFTTNLHQHHDSHHALQQQNPECYSDEVDSRSGDGVATDSEKQRHPKRQRKSSAQPATAPPPPPLANAPGTGGGSEDEATVEVPKRPRGRPPGSRNKPKPPVVITHDADADATPATMRPHVLEVRSGQDVVDALSRFSRRHNLGLCVLAGTGLVSNVVLRHASSSPVASTDVSFPGHFEILSMSATFLPPSFAPSTPSALPEGGVGVSVSLAGPHGQVFGGLVAGPLTAAGTVTVLAAAFCNPTYHRLPTEDEVSVSVSVSVSGGGGGGNVETARPHAPDRAPRHQLQRHNSSSHRHQQQQHPQQQQQRQQQQQQRHDHQQQQQPQQRSSSPPSPSSAAATAAAVQQHHGSDHPAAAFGAAPTAGEAYGMSMYSCHLPSEVIWAPAARSPPY